MKGPSLLIGWALLTAALAAFDFSSSQQRLSDLRFRDNARQVPRTLRSVLRRLRSMSARAEYKRQTIESEMSHSLARLEAINIDSVLPPAHQPALSFKI